MLVDFNKIKEQTVANMNGGTGELSVKMFVEENGKIIPCRIHAGGSIGLHRHPTSDDINYVVSGTGKAICDGIEERLTEGCVHICKKGSEHSIINDGNDDLVMITIVVER